MMKWNSVQQWTHKRAARVALVATFMMLLTACAPEIGSERWCTMMNDKAKGEWTANDAAAYAKHCVLGIKPGQQ